jgi:hypothetical protein
MQEAIPMTPDEIQDLVNTVYICDGSDFDRNFPVLVARLGDWEVDMLFVLSSQFLLQGMPVVAHAIAEYADKCWAFSYRGQERPDPSQFIPDACKFWQRDAEERFEWRLRRLHAEPAGSA